MQRRNVLSAIRLAPKIFSRERVMCWSSHRSAKSLFFDAFQSREKEILHAGDSGTCVAFSEGTCRFRVRQQAKHRVPARNSNWVHGR
jgi:hypothetical protein